MGWDCILRPSCFLHLVSRTAPKVPKSPRHTLLLLSMLSISGNSAGGNLHQGLMWRGRRLRQGHGVRTTMSCKDGLWKREARWIQGRKKKAPAFHFQDVLTQAWVSSYLVPVLDLVTIVF